MKNSVDKSTSCIGNLILRLTNIWPREGLTG